VLQNLTPTATVKPPISAKVIQSVGDSLLVKDTALGPVAHSHSQAVLQETVGESVQSDSEFRYHKSCSEGYVPRSRLIPLQFGSTLQHPMLRSAEALPKF